MTHRVEHRTIGIGSCPFPGPRSYTEEQKDLFFGREVERQRIVGNLRAARLTLLYAESGVGKSSLLNAAVLPRLRESATASRSDPDALLQIPVLVNSWSDDPIADVIDGLVAAAQAFGPEHLVLPPGRLDEALLTVALVMRAQILIVLDQFEELLLYLSPDRREVFAEQLASCLTRGDVPANFLIAIREDAYAAIGDLLKGRIPNVYGNYLHLEHLDRSEAREAIVMPVRQWNDAHPDVPPVELEPQLVEAVLDQVRCGEVLADQPVPEARFSPSAPDRIDTIALQLVMSRLWAAEDAAGSRVLRLATLVELGGAAVIFDSYLDRAMAEIPETQWEIAASIFSHLVTSTGRKIALTAGELAGDAGLPEAEVAAVLRRLADRDNDVHVLRQSMMRGASDHVSYEIFHDALARPILDWRTRYLRERKDRELAAAKARLRRERRLRVGLTLALVAAVVLVVVALVLWSNAEQAKRTANAQTRRAQAAELASRSLEPFHGEQKLETALKAVEQDPTPSGRRALRLAIAQPHVDRAFPGRIEGVANGTDLLDWSATAATLVAGGENGAWAWGPSWRRPVRLATGSVDTVGLSGDGHHALVVTHGVIDVFHFDHGRKTEKVIRPPSKETFIYAAMNRDGTRLMTLTDHVAVYSGDGSQVRALPQLADVEDASWSPDGRLAILDGNSQLTLWNDQAEQLASVPGRVYAYQFSNDGSTIVAGGDKGAQEWRVQGMQRLASIPTTGRVSLVKLVEADGADRLVIGDTSGTVTVAALEAPGDVAAIDVGQLPDDVDVSGPNAVVTLPGGVSVWDLRIGTRVGGLQGLSGRLSHVQIRPDGTYSFVQADRDGRIRLFRGRTGVRLAAQPNAESPTLVASWDPRRLVEVAQPDNDFEIQVRSVTDLSPVSPPLRPSAPGQGPSTLLWTGIDTSGRVVATVNHYAGIRPATRIELWDVTTGTRRSELRSRFPAAYVSGADFSPNLRFVAVAGWDPSRKTNQGFTELVPSDGSPARSLDRCVCTDTAVAFSRDGRGVLIGDDRGRAVLRRVDGRGVAVGHDVTFKDRRSKQQLDAVAISGKWVATGDSSGRIVVWSMVTRRRVRTYDLGRDVTALSFSPDESLLVADGVGVQSRVFRTVSGPLHDAVFENPVAEPGDQSVLFDPTTGSSGVHLLLFDGHDLLRYPCASCETDEAVLARAKRTVSLAGRPHRFAEVP